jgi:dTDP-4-dehydrorhamnose 3,5-epimerase-like enzyme
MCLGNSSFVDISKQNKHWKSWNRDSLNANDSADLHVPEISTEGLSEVNNEKQMNNYKAPTFVDVEINE